ncbi:DEP domain-containing protein 7-like [Cyprinodon tularosa]|uniref:DEP domain-containing protein 7-like n=1 Tax=Cyprinodon tularosa TaxID=77115 RepID=UPI0018E27409|nr:DEP domain-containing protein 7-like [Cyprinodon tularosa]
MSSIKERAAALNLAEKLCVRPQAPIVAVKPTQASSMWSSLISHFRSNVTVKRRLVHLRSHSDCFLGSEAVDVLIEHITKAEGFEGASITREKVACVCQALMDCDVFEAVGTKVLSRKKKQDAFEDSRNALYRFAGSRLPSVEELERGSLMNGIQELFCRSPSDGLGKQVDMSIPATVLKTPEKICHLRSGFTTKGTTEYPVDGPSKEQKDPALPQSLVNEVCQEQTLLRLLQIVELPLLEGVLQCCQNPPAPPQTSMVAHGKPDLISSNNQLDRWILKAFRDSQSDEWLSRALDCLDFLPDQLVAELSRELPPCFRPEKESDEQQPQEGSSIQDGGPSSDDQTGLTPSLAQWKLQLYRTLVRHYSDTARSPLLPQNMTDVHAAITDLLVNAKLDKALEALQLCLKLLAPNRREELRRLLTFMSSAAEPKAVNVDKEMENRLAVKKSFCKAILHSKTFPKEKEDLLLVFMLSNIEEIFKTPGSLLKVISEKLHSLSQGTSSEVTVCPAGASLGLQASIGVDSLKKNTNQELWILLNNIHLDNKMSAKERRRLLRQFYLSHPEIYNQYFGETAATEL